MSRRRITEEDVDEQTSELIAEREQQLLMLTRVQKYTQRIVKRDVSTPAKKELYKNADVDYSKFKFRSTTSLYPYQLDVVQRILDHRRDHPHGGKMLEA